MRIRTVAVASLLGASIGLGPVPSAQSVSEVTADCGSGGNDDWFLWDMPECVAGADGRGCTSGREFRKVREGWSRQRVMRKLSSRRILVADSLESDEYSARITAYSTRPCDRENVAQFVFTFRALPDGAGGYRVERLKEKTVLWGYGT